MFQPKYTITPIIAKGLMRVEAVKQSITDLPITPKVIKTLRETARLYSTHYSTMIEGNELSQNEVKIPPTLLIVSVMKMRFWVIMLL